MIARARRTCRVSPASGSWSTRTARALRSAAAASWCSHRSTSASSSSQGASCARASSIGAPDRGGAGLGPPLCAGDRRIQQQQLRQVHALAQLVGDLQRFLELRLRAHQDRRPAAGPPPHSPAPHWRRRACRAGCSLRRPRGSGGGLRAVAPFRACAQPRNQRHAVRPCARENSSTSACISSARAATRSALPRRTSSSASLPGGDEARHRLPQRARALAAPAATCARACSTRPRCTSSMASIPSSVTCGSAAKTSVQPPGRAPRRWRARALSMRAPPAAGPADGAPRRAGSTPTSISAGSSDPAASASARFAPPPAPPHIRRAGSARSQSRATGARASRARAQPASSA